MNIPIIDRAIFFDNPEIAGGQLSPNGKYLAFLKAYNGILNIYAKEVDQPFEKAWRLTTSKSPIMEFSWTYDSLSILYVDDQDGDENFTIYAVEPNGKSVPRTLIPQQGIRAFIYHVSKNDPDLLMVGINDRDKAWHDLYSLRISSGKLELIYQNENRITGWYFDWEGSPRLAVRTAENGYNELLRVDKNNHFTKIMETDLSESASVEGWVADNSRCYLVTNKGELDKSALYLLNPENGVLELLEADPLDKVDFGGFRINRDTRQIIYTHYTDDRTRYYWQDKGMEKDFAFLEERFSDREVIISSTSGDYNLWLVATTGDKYASSTYLYNRLSGDLSLQYIPQPRLKEVEHFLAPMTPVSYPSSDGLIIPGYLTLPLNNKKKLLPTIVMVHGGPKGPRDYWGYNSTVQFLANRGYAVLQPNFRASGGYGKTFLNAGDKEWGKKMQDDITFGVKYLIGSGISDPEKIAIMGGSYGGYATLAGLAFTPEVYACGIDIVGPSNLFTLLNTIPPYWEAAKKWLYEMVGDPETEEGQKLLREASPLFSAENIVRPLLIIQGANDPRVKQAESDQIVHALHSKRKDVVYLNALDEGHGYRKPLNRMAMYAAIEEFLSRHLGGRHQSEIPDDVQSTLSLLAVDPNTVSI